MRVSDPRPIIPSVKVFTSSQDIESIVEQLTQISVDIFDHRIDRECLCHVERHVLMLFKQTSGQLTDRENNTGVIGVNECLESVSQ